MAYPRAHVEKIATSRKKQPSSSWPVSKWGVWTMGSVTSPWAGLAKTRSVPNPFAAEQDSGGQSAAASVLLDETESAGIDPETGREQFRKKLGGAAAMLGA